MRGDRIDFLPLRGLHEEIPALENSASRLVNWTVDPRSKGWDDRIGYEKFFVGASLYTPFETLGRIDSLYCWSRHNGAQEWMLLEAEGTLYWLRDYTSTIALHALVTGRVVPAVSAPGASYAPFGRFLCVVNGADKPLRIALWGATLNSPALPVYPLGWEAPCPAPDVWQVDTSPDTIEGNGKIGIWADLGTEYGLGSTTAAAPNAYRWRFAFLSNTGSISPLSAPSDKVAWLTPAAGDFANRRFIVGMNIPVGPVGTIARIAYRVKNLGNDDLGVGEVQTYYFVAQIPGNTEDFWYDHWSDNQLGSEAPGLSDSVVMPAPGARFAAQFKSCLFLDGGVTDEGSIYWSVPGKPDQFAANSRATVDTHVGGGLSGFYAHSNFLLVLREREIDVVTGSYGSFAVRTLAAGVGSRAGGSADSVPGLGVFVFTTAGVMLIAGATDGGGTVSVRNLTPHLVDEIRRAHPDLLARATGRYSPKWREYHVYFPADGSNVPSLGLVYSLDKDAWSVREGFPVGALTVNANGDFLFGHHTGDDGSSHPPAGVFAITRRRVAGHVVSGGVAPTIDYAGTLTSTYRSAWLSPGGDLAHKRKVLYLYLYALTEGDSDIPLTIYKDRNASGVDVAAIRLQRADWPDQGVYDTVTIDGTHVWEEELASVYRVAVSSAFARSTIVGQAGNAVTEWAFEIETDSDIVLYGYAIEYTADEDQVILDAKRAL